MDADQNPFTMFIGEREADISVERGYNDRVSITFGESWKDLTVAEALTFAKSIIDVAARIDFRGAVEAVLTP